jgi:protein SSD1
MTDEITPQAQPSAKKDEKKPSSLGGNRGGPKRQTSNSSNLRGGASGARPSSRGSNKKVSTATSTVESGSDTASRKGSESGKKQDNRGKNQAGGGRGQPYRRGQPAASHGTRNSKDQGLTKQSSSPAPVQSKDSSDALSSLQRVIADLKTTSPVQPPVGSNNPAIMPSSQGHSNLPLHAPVFQPGASAYPAPNQDQKHRKAISLGNSASAGNFSSYSPHLGAMMEDVEDGASFEEGEIPERFYQQQPGHQPRSQSQSFMAPRFAALAAQQEQDTVGPTGRPQLAPGFMFGARRRALPMGPPINEEDIGFQFPQQQQQQDNFVSDIPQQTQGHRKTESGEITGIMAEQVSDCFLCSCPD